MSMQPNYYTFFDVDGTVINIKSMFSFLRYFYIVESGLLGIIKFYFFKFNTFLLENLGVSREFLNKRYYKKFKNYSEVFIEKIGENWFKQEIEQNHLLFIDNVIKEIKAHKYNNAEIVLVSGSFPACLKPIAYYLDVGTVLSTGLETKNGRFTGNILRQTIGKGKAEAISHFLKVNNYSLLQKCYAYGDHESDIEMLNMVGNPRVIAGDKNIESYAKERGWVVVGK